MLRLVSKPAKGVLLPAAAAAQAAQRGSVHNQLIRQKPLNAAVASAAGYLPPHIYDEDEDLDGPMKQVHHVHSRLPLCSVALGDSSMYIISWEDGGISWSADLPDHLYDRLDTISEQEEGIAYAAMGRIGGSDTYNQPADGDDEVWFLRQGDGTTWLGSSCDQTLQNVWWGGNQDHFVKNVYFAPGNGWFVLKSGGGARWQGLPDSLEDSLHEYWDEFDGVDTLSVGPNGEWIVKYGTGHFQWCGVHPVLARLLKHKSDLTGSLEWAELGPDGTFVALFEQYTVWYGDEELTDALLSATE